MLVIWINNVYIKKNDCDVIYLEEESEWFDSGTFESLFDASEYVKKNYNSWVIISYSFYNFLNCVSIKT